MISGGLRRQEIKPKEKNHINNVTGLELLNQIYVFDIDECVSSCHSLFCCLGLVGIVEKLIEKPTRVDKHLL